MKWFYPTGLCCISSRSKLKWLIVIQNIIFGYVYVQVNVVFDKLLYVLGLSMVEHHFLFMLQLAVVFFAKPI